MYIPLCVCSSKETLVAEICWLSLKFMTKRKRIKDAGAGAVAGRKFLLGSHEQIIKKQARSLPTPIQHQNNINALPRCTWTWTWTWAANTVAPPPFPSSVLSAVCARELQLNWNYALCDGGDPRGILRGRQSRSARFSYLPNARVKYDEALSSYSGINQRWRWTEDKFRDLLPALTCIIMQKLGGELIAHSICLLFNYSLQLLIDAWGSTHTHTHTHMCIF